MPRTSDGRIIRAVRTAHGLISVAARILGVEEATIEKRAEASARVAQEIGKAQAFAADRAELKLIEAALRGEPWAIRFLLTARGRHRIPDAKSWSDGINDLSEPELVELEQRLGISYEPLKLPQTNPEPTLNRPCNHPRMTPKSPHPRGRDGGAIQERAEG